MSARTTHDGDALADAAEAFALATAETAKLTEDAAALREVTALSGGDLARRADDLARAEAGRREARKALHKAAEAAALALALGGPGISAPARARTRAVPAPAGAPARRGAGGGARDVPAPAGVRTSAPTREAPPSSSPATRPRAPVAPPAEGTAAAALLAWRLARGIGRRAAGELLGVSGTYVGALEAGRTRPSAAVAARLDDVAGVTVESWGTLARPAAGGRRKGGPRG